MREIEFRGKCVETKEWIYGYLYKGTLALTETPLCLADCRNYTAIMKEGTLYHVIPETVGEFTGRYDDEGMKVYTNDLVKDEENFIWEVVFKDGKFMLENMEFPGIKEIDGGKVVGNLSDGIDLDECNCSDKDCENCKLYFAENV